jgi:hypothetical protein
VPRPPPPRRRRGAAGAAGAAAASRGTAGLAGAAPNSRGAAAAVAVTPGSPCPVSPRPGSPCPGSPCPGSGAVARTGGSRTESPSMSRVSISARLPFTRTSPLRTMRYRRVRGSPGYWRVRNRSRRLPAWSSPTTAWVTAVLSVISVTSCFSKAFIINSHGRLAYRLTRSIQAPIAARSADGGRRMLVGPRRRGHRIRPIVAASGVESSRLPGALSAHRPKQVPSRGSQVPGQAERTRTATTR